MKKFIPLRLVLGIIRHRLWEPSYFQTVNSSVEWYRIFASNPRIWDGYFWQLINKFVSEIEIFRSFFYRKRLYGIIWCNTSDDPPSALRKLEWYLLPKKVGESMNRYFLRKRYTGASIYWIRPSRSSAPLWQENR